MKSWISQLTKIVGKTVELEEKLEELRSNLKVCFKNLDVFEHGFITGADFMNYLISKGVFFEAADINLFVATWDWDQDGRLTYEEFWNWAEGGELSDESSNELLQMLILEIKTLAELEAEKFKLSQMEGFNMLDLFLMVEPKDSVIFCDGFWRFFGNSYEIGKVVKVFRRICKSDIGQVRYFEFADFFMYNKAYYCLGDSFPDQELTPLSLNYSVYKSLVENTTERSEIFSKFSPQPAAPNPDRSQSLNTQKIALALRKDFTTKALFRYFAGKKKTVNKLRFLKGCKKIGLTQPSSLFTGLEIGGELTEEDFFEAFAPKSEAYRLLLKNRAKQSVEIGPETMNLISELLNSLLN